MHISRNDVALEHSKTYTNSKIINIKAHKSTNTFLCALNKDQRSAFIYNALLFEHIQISLDELVIKIYTNQAAALILTRQRPTIELDTFLLNCDKISKCFNDFHFRLQEKRRCTVVNALNDPVLLELLLNHDKNTTKPAISNLNWRFLLHRRT